MRKQWFLVGLLLLLASLLVAGCGIPQKDYDAVVAERDAAQAKVKSLEDDLAGLQAKLTGSEAGASTLQADLASANSIIKNLQGDVSAQRNINSSLSTELNKVKDPRHFTTLAELTDWVAKDDTNTKYTTEGNIQRSFILQVRALRDGYLLPVSLYVDTSGNLLVGNRAVIGDAVYWVLAPNDSIGRYATTQPITSHPLPLP